MMRVLWRGLDWSKACMDVLNPYQWLLKSIVWDAIYMVDLDLVRSINVGALGKIKTFLIVYLTLPMVCLCFT